MTDNDLVDVKFTNFTGDYSPGQRGSLPAEEAKRFIRAGVAVPATASAAKAVGADPDTAATKRS